MDKFWIESFTLSTSAYLLPSIFEQLKQLPMCRFPGSGGFLSSWRLACTQAVCGRISTTFAIFRQKSGRGFLRFSLSLALFRPFPFFRLSLFSAFFLNFCKFPLFVNKSLCGGERSIDVLNLNGSTSLYFCQISTFRALWWLGVTHPDSLPPLHHQCVMNVIQMKRRAIRFL